MPRYVHPDLKAHLQGDATTLCLCIRFDPVSSAPSYGVTTNNRDVTYDHADGSGAMVFAAAIGADVSSMQSRSDLSVDNAEATSLMPEFDVQISEADIRAGMYDFARYRAFIVNYRAPTAGTATEIRAGTIGRVSIDDNGLSFVNELRGLVAELKQSVCERDSLTCRATFGSQKAGSATHGPIERFPCGVDATALLVSGTVTSVGAENTLTFTVGGFTMDADELNPGMVFWLTGQNAGRSNEIDTNTDAGEITLAHETDFPIAVGDTLQYRVDCNKQARDDVKGCKAPIRWGPNWVLHFRGEPDIPIGDAGALETPGASSAPGEGGYTQQPTETVAE